MSELKITDIIVGAGIEAGKGALVICHYTGTLEDGTKFDSSHDHGKAYQFVVGSTKVIKGMSQGVMGMRAGGKRIIHIPAALAYGERAIGRFIKANSNLIFEVELLEVRPRE